MPDGDTTPRMTLTDALDVLHATRGDAVVVTSMGSAREWTRRFEPHPLDFVHVPSSMGQTPAIGLGIALARSSIRVITCVGDGSLLMNLGCLTTIAAADPGNLVLIVFENGAYEVTGAQPTPAAQAAAQIDYAKIASAAGFPVATSLGRLADWRAEAATLLRAKGPVCVNLKIEADPSAGPVDRLPAATDRVQAFSDALRVAWEFRSSSHEDGGDELRA